MKIHLSKKSNLTNINNKQLTIKEEVSLGTRYGIIFSEDNVKLVKR